MCAGFWYNIGATISIFSGHYTTRVTHLFFAFLASVQLVRENYQVVLLDSMYKTNMFKMPLLHLVDMTATNMTFSIGFCFMQAEREADYIWAATRAKWCFDQVRQPKVLITDRELVLMSALELTFPSAATILCVRLIQKSVLSNVKQHFSRGCEFERCMSCWRDLILSKTVADFETSWSIMQMEFCALVVGYLALAWFPHKEKFVKAWTRHVTHFGHVATSRVEGCHAFVKKWMSTSTGDFNDIVDRIHLALENQAREFAARAAYN